MKKFKVRVYRNGGWFRKYVEEFEVEADEMNDYKDGVDFIVYKNGNKYGCEGITLVAQFKADKYTVIEIK